MTDFLCVYNGILGNGREANEGKLAWRSTGMSSDVLAAAFSIKFLWYPWALAPACQMLSFVEDLQLSFWEGTQLQLHLSRWVGPAEKSIYDNYLKGRETFCLAEAILRLSFVESLKT